MMQTLYVPQWSHQGLCVLNQPPHLTPVCFLLGAPYKWPKGKPAAWMRPRPKYFRLSEMSSVFLSILDLITSCVLSLYKHKHTYTTGFVHDAKNGSFHQYRIPCSNLIVALPTWESFVVCAFADCRHIQGGFVEWWKDHGALWYNYIQSNAQILVYGWMNFDKCIHLLLNTTRYTSCPSL